MQGIFEIVKQDSFQKTKFSHKKNIEEKGECFVMGTFDIKAEREIEEQINSFRISSIFLKTRTTDVQWDSWDDLLVDIRLILHFVAMRIWGGRRGICIAEGVLYLQGQTLQAISSSQIHFIMNPSNSYGNECQMFSTQDSSQHDDPESPYGTKGKSLIG